MRHAKKTAPAIPGHLDVSTPVFNLPQRWQNAYEKRREENMVKFKLADADASEEARLFVARQMYIDATRKEEAAKQLPIFAGERLPKMRRR